MIDKSECVPNPIQNHEVPELDAISVSQLKSRSLYHTKVELGDKWVDAVVDTAAESTIISDKLYNSLVPKPPKRGRLRFMMAGRDTTMDGFKIGPVSFRVGSSIYQEVLHVAPIEDEMLLGFDFLFKNGANLDMKKNVLSIGENLVPLQIGSLSKPPRVARVIVSKRRVVPPHSSLGIKCKLSEGLTDYIVESNPITKLAIPRSVHHCDKNTLEVCVLNLSDNYKVVKKGENIATAMEAEVVQGDTDSHSGFPLSRETEQIEQPFVPDHLKDMFENSCQNLSEEQSDQLRRVLIEFQDVFAKHTYDLGNFNAIEHEINTGDAKPVKSKMRRTPLKFAGEEEAELQKMLDAGVIKPSVSDWASAPVLIRKRDGTVRYCLDFRALNAISTKDVYPLPLVEDCLDTLTGSQWFSKLDANCAYWQIGIREEDRKKTAFITKYGLFEHVKMPFGLCNAPATFSRAINLVLRGLNWKTVLAFLDDILVLGKDFQHHLSNLRETLSRFREYGLKLKPKKCEFFQRKTEFLGRIISHNTIEMAQTDIETILAWPRPKNSKEVERFMGLANYHRLFIKNFAKLASPLYELTKKKKFQWTERQELAFESLKKSLVNPPVLALPKRDGEMILDTDASEYCIGAELLQIQDGKEMVIAYASLSLTPEQRNYCTTRKELLAIVRFTRQFRHYLLGQPFLVRTDHSSLQWLLNFREPQGQLARWMEELSQYNMIVEHRKGHQHTNADALSRISEKPKCNSYRPQVKLSDLPCLGCPYCTKAHTQWDRFHENVDDAVPLANGPASRINQSCLCPNDGSGFIWDPGGELPVVFEMCVKNGEVSVSDESTSRISKTAQVVSKGPPNQAMCWGFSREEIQSKQATDPQLKFIFSWMHQGSAPTEGELFLADPATKHYWINKELFSVQDGLLFYKPKGEGNLRLVLPYQVQQIALQLNHDLPSSGHQGVSRTTFRMKEKYYWYGMTKDIDKYVTSCNICNQNKKSPRASKSPMTTYHAGAPMERVHIDFLGPLPKTKHGNQYILMIVDQFTKWVEIIPTTCQTAEETARNIVNHFFCRFGVPFQILSDQGRNFESELFAALCKALQIHKTRTTPYRPSANGQAERYNRTIMEAVRCFIGKNQSKWDENIFQLAGALRSTVNRQTGFTPNKLMLGREINIPADIMFPSNQLRNDEPNNSYVADLVEEIKRAHNTARETLKMTQKRMKKNYDIRVLERQYAKNDLVYLLDTAATKGKCRKLSPPWRGPGIILDCLTPYLYRVQLSNKIVVVNHDKLKMCRDRVVPTWIKTYKEQTTVDTQDDNGVYCLCKKPWSGQFMIQCDYCQEWYHGSCIDLTPSEALSIDKFRCQDCGGVPRSSPRQ